MASGHWLAGYRLLDRRGRVGDLMSSIYQTRQKAWTPQEDAWLRLFWKENWPTLQIGIALERSKNSVIGRAYRLDLPRRAAIIPEQICPEQVAAFQQWQRQMDAGHEAARFELARAA